MAVPRDFHSDPAFLRPMTVISDSLRSYLVEDQIQGDPALFPAISVSMSVHVPPITTIILVQIRQLCNLAKHIRARYVGHSVIPINSAQPSTFIGEKPNFWAGPDRHYLCSTGPGCYPALFFVETFTYVSLRREIPDFIKCPAEIWHARWFFFLRFSPRFFVGPSCR
jgi:hypothetical protein